MQSGDCHGLQNRRAAGHPVAGVFDSHTLPPSFLRLSTNHVAAEFRRGGRAPSPTHSHKTRMSGAPGLPPRDLLRHRLQHHILYFHRPLHRGLRVGVHASHGLLTLAARKADISCAISTGHIMCYRQLAVASLTSPPVKRTLRPALGLGLPELSIPSR